MHRNSTTNLFYQGGDIMEAGPDCEMFTKEEEKETGQLSNILERIYISAKWITSQYFLDKQYHSAM